MIRFSVFSVVFLAALPIYAQECEAPPEVKAAIEAAPGRSSDERVAAAGKVRDQFPSDYFAHRFY